MGPSAVAGRVGAFRRRCRRRGFCWKEIGSWWRMDSSRGSGCRCRKEAGEHAGRASIGDAVRRAPCQGPVRRRRRRLPVKQPGDSQPDTIKEACREVIRPGAPPVGSCNSPRLVRAILHAWMVWPEPARTERRQACMKGCPMGACMPVSGIGQMPSTTERVVCTCPQRGSWAFLRVIDHTARSVPNDRSPPEFDCSSGMSD